MSTKEISLPKGRLTTVPPKAKTPTNAKTPTKATATTKAKTPIKAKTPTKASPTRAKRIARWEKTFKDEPYPEGKPVKDIESLIRGAKTPSKTSPAARKALALAAPLVDLFESGLPLTRVKGDYLAKLLVDYPVGQKRSAPLPLRQFVFMAGDEVIKGPYRPNDVKLDTILRRSAQFRKWKSPNTIHPTRLIEAQEGIYLVFDNIADMSNPVLEMGYKESFSEHVYDVLINNTALPLNKFFGVPENKSVDKGRYITRDLILSLCHCAILSVGDCQIRNFLVDPATGRVLVTDYDEARGPATIVLKGELFYLTKAPGKAYKWAEHARPHLAYCAEKCRQIHVDATLFSEDKVAVYEARLAKVIELLDEYSSPDAPPPAPPTPVTRPRGAKKTPKLGRGAKSPAVAVVLSAKPRGDPVYKGPFAKSNASEHGFAPDILKSGVQKYVRRNSRVKAFACLAELLSFSRAGEAAKGMVTNTLNRLMIIAAEDIGLANVQLVARVIHEVSALKEKLKSKDMSRKDRKALFGLVALMCASPKTRIMSHAYYVYANPESKEEREKHDIVWEEAPSKEDEARIRKSPHPELFNKEDTKEMRHDALMVYLRLEDAAMDAFTWVERFKETYQGGKIKLRSKYVDPSPYKGKGSTPMCMIWSLYSLFLEPSLYNELAHCYHTLAEQRPFASLALMACIYRDALPHPQVKVDGWEEDYDQTDASTLVIDDYVVDKHTGQGRTEGKDTQLFVTEGSLVVPEDLNLTNPILLEIYQSRE